MTMATVLDLRRQPPEPLAERPAFVHLVGEFGDLMLRRRIARSALSTARDHDGEKRPVLLVPGFLASDRSMLGLRGALRAANYNPFGWHQGRNFGVKRDTLPRLDARLGEIHEATGKKVALVGWSVGGLIARELAKMRPQSVDRVITLGSPFSGDPRSGRAWRLYEWVAGHKVDAPPVDCTLTEKPPVPTLALWAKRDGVVTPASACGCATERDEAWGVDCNHMGLVTRPAAVAATLAALAGGPA